MPSSPETASQLVGSWVAELSVEDIAKRMEETGAPYGIVQSMHEAIRGPYFEERGMLAEVPDPLDGSIRVVGSPLHFSQATSGPQARGAPLAGQHTRAILRSIGYTDEDVGALLASRAVAQQELGET